METKDVILELRTKKGLSQDELAEKVMNQIDMGENKNGR